MMINLVSLLFILFASSCLTVKLRSIQMNMYMTSSFDFCMRYLTKHTITGCSSRKSGNHGRLIDISSLTNLTSYKHSQSIIILIPAQRDILEFAIYHAPMVVGILIDGRTMNATENYFTEVGICPDDYIGSSTSSSNCSIRKNKYGIDFRGRHIDKPIFLLTNQTAVDELRKISDLYNQQQLFKGKHIDVHMKSYPYGAKNAQVCNRRSKSSYFGEAYFKHYLIKCRSPMINIVWSTFNPISTKTIRPPKSVVILYTKFDFFSIFQPPNAGAQSTGLGVITLLSLAWVLGRMDLSQLLILNKGNQDIVLLFLNGDNWNYQGTLELNAMILKGQFPYTVQKTSKQDGLHPIEAKHIDLIINIDQLGLDHGDTHILYDNLHPFLQEFQKNSPTSTTLQHMTDTFNSLADFRLLNVSTLAMMTNAYEDMNPFYNSYQDTLTHVKNYSSIENHIYSLVKTICSYFKLSTTCSNDLSLEIKQALLDRIQALIDCFLRSNCSHLISTTNDTGVFYFHEVSNNMKETFSFLQPVLHQSEVKSYLNKHFLDASSYIHDILFNWIATRTLSTTKSACDETEDVFRLKIYQQSTETCLRASTSSMNLIRDNEEVISDRMIFTSNYDEPQLLVHMVNDTPRDLIMLLCGIILCICGLMLTYFLKHPLPIIFDRDETF